VLKLHVLALPRLFPATSSAAVVMVTLQEVLAGSAADGVKVATLPLTA
jgi:hypothetical protein